MINAHDAKILRLLQKNCNLTAEEIAAEVSLSHSTVQKRLRRLRSSGAIEREIALISRKAVGGFSLFIVHIQLARVKKNSIARFRKLMTNTKEVIQCYHVTGACDFIIIVATRDIDSYAAFSEDMFTEENHVIRFDTNVVLSPVKYGFELPF